MAIAGVGFKPSIKFCLFFKCCECVDSRHKHAKWWCGPLNHQIRNVYPAAVIKSEIYILQLCNSKFELMCALAFTEILSVPVCLEAHFCCLHVFFVSMSGSGTSKWAGDLYLTHRAKICFAFWLFLLSSFASSDFFPSILPVFSSFMSMFVYIHSGWKSQTREDAARAVLSFSSSFPSPISSLKSRRSSMLGVSKLASVLGVPGEQPRHNSRVEWTVKRREGKMNSMLWGFPNPNSLQGLFGTTLCCIYPYLSQLTNHPARDEGQRLKNVLWPEGFSHGRWKFLRSGL